MEKIIIDSAKKSPRIDENGNISYIDGSNKCCLVVEKMVENKIETKRLTKDYYSMVPIQEKGLEDFYIVCDAVCDAIYDDFSYYTEEFGDSILSFKYGIIALQRDKKGNIIPMGEKVVVPCLYDRIYENNLKSVTAYVNDHLTYIDIDLNSKNYGKQLVPVVLEHAASFSVKYEGFAECSVDGITGYLPRNCQPKTALSPLELLSEEQVEYLLQYFKLCNNTLHEDSVNKYSELTDNAKVLKLTKN